MATNGKNYSTLDAGALGSLGQESRAELGDKLGLSGCEISVNRVPAGKGQTFTHTHKLNEEVYIVIAGSGLFRVDDDVFSVHEGSFIRVAPAGQRTLKAGDEGMTYLCIQAEQGSLTQRTQGDGEIGQTDVVW